MKAFLIAIIILREEIVQRDGVLIYQFTLSIIITCFKQVNTLQDKLQNNHSALIKVLQAYFNLNPAPYKALTDRLAQDRMLVTHKTVLAV
jgi:hypothetical protein